MPWKPKRPCLEVPCGQLVDASETTGRCEGHRVQHLKARQQRQDGTRPNAYRRGYDRYWERARRVWLREFPICAECERGGFITAATLVDHIEPHRGDKDLFWDRDNWQSLCKPCHDRKTALETFHNTES